MVDAARLAGVQDGGDLDPAPLMSAFADVPSDRYGASDDCAARISVGFVIRAE